MKTKRDYKGRYAQDRSLYRAFIIATGIMFAFTLTFVGVRHVYEVIEKAYQTVIEVHNTKADEPKTKEEIKNYLITEARKIGVDEKKVIWIVEHESMYNLQAIGDGGHSRGLWQIHEPSNPEVSIECAFSLECSTKWSLKEIKKGNIWKWSSYKYCRAWYADCPFKLK